MTRRRHDDAKKSPPAARLLPRDSSGRLASQHFRQSWRRRRDAFARRHASMPRTRLADKAPTEFDDYARHIRRHVYARCCLSSPMPFDSPISILKRGSSSSAMMKHYFWRQTVAHRASFALARHFATAIFGFSSKAVGEIGRVFTLDSRFTACYLIDAMRRQEKSHQERFSPIMPTAPPASR